MDGKKKIWRAFNLAMDEKKKNWLSLNLEKYCTNKVISLAFNFC